MTDTSLLAATHSTGDSYPVTAPIHSPVPNGAISDSVPLEDEEPYTIKCICAFEDDDGNTVFCEKCETWQHIECYYHGQEVPDEHFCTECAPSPLYLDGKRATERQRRLREQSDSGDRKAKRSGSKTQKKKIQQYKDQDAVNGHRHRSDSSSRDQPPAVKKSKSSHKSSASVNSVSVASKLQPESRKRSGSVATMSPTKSSTFPQIPLYSHEFLHLYDNDRGYVNMKSNLVVNIHLLGDMGSWVKDPSALLRAGTGRSPQEIFTYADVLDSSRWPELSLDTVVDKDLEIEGVNPTWKVLKTQTAVHKDQIVGEVKGKIGQLRDYCHDPSNRWPELRHPQPFVFFHPQLPIYIDSREEGSILRYVRRSCRPNVTMKTFITNEVEYHFCYVANQDIPAGSEVTAMWYYDRQLSSGFNNSGMQESGDSDQEEARAISMSNILAHFGGCACIPRQNCLLAAVDRRRHPSSKLVNGRRKKLKSKSVVSPASVGRSTTSRAGSEAAVEDDNTDNRSTSGSVRGHTRSRDLTPTQLPPDWALQDSELSQRDRRKIAAVEKKFEQLEHDQHGGSRKKKRSSGTSTHPNHATPLPKHSNSTTSQSGKSLKLDTATSRLSDRTSLSAYHRGSRPSPRKSSPISTAIRSPLSRPSYVDGSQQTRSPRIGFSPLGRRLLKRCHEDSSKAQWPAKHQEMPPGTASTDAAASPSPSMPAQPWSSSIRPSSSHSGEDVEMKDVGDDSKPLPYPNDVMMKPPLPSTAAHNTLIPGLNHRSGGLHVQMPPNHFAVPTSTTPGAGMPGSLQSPSDSLTQPVQTPGGSITAPSPVKKKMSLGDYLGRRGTMATPTTEKSQAQANANLAPPSKPVLPHLQSSTPPLSTDGEVNAVTGTEPIKNEVSPADTDVPMKDVSSKPPISPPYLSTLEMQDDSKFSPTK